MKLDKLDRLEKPKREKRVFLGFRLPESLIRRVREDAAQRGWTLTEWLEAAVKSILGGVK